MKNRSKNNQQSLVLLIEVGNRILVLLWTLINHDERLTLYNTFLQFKTFYIYDYIDDYIFYFYINTYYNFYM